MPPGHGPPLPAMPPGHPNPRRRLHCRRHVTPVTPWTWPSVGHHTRTRPHAHSTPRTNHVPRDPPTTYCACPTRPTALPYVPQPALMRRCHTRCALAHHDAPWSPTPPHATRRPTTTSAAPRVPGLLARPCQRSPWTRPAPSTGIHTPPAPLTRTVPSRCAATAPVRAPRPQRASQPYAHAPPRPLWACPALFGMRPTSCGCVPSPAFTCAEPPNAPNMRPAPTMRPCTETMPHDLPAPPQTHPGHFRYAPATFNVPLALFDAPLPH